MKEYLGDSVYAEEDGIGGIVLTTENGAPSGPSNTIFMESEVIMNFIAYVKKRAGAQNT